MEAESSPPADQPEQQSEPEKEAPPAPKAPLLSVTNALIVINTLVFLFECYKGGVSALTEPATQTILDTGANFGPLFATGDYWRCFTSMFVHIGALHLLMNMFALQVVGKDVEVLYGPTKYLTLYLLAGIGGALASLYWGPVNVSAGASGAVFGAFGALLAYGWSKRKYYSPERLAESNRLILTVIGYNLIYGLISPHIDNAAHVGGLISGLLAALCLVHDKPDDKRWEVKDLLRVSIFAVALTYFGFYDRQKIENLPAVKSMLEEQKAVELIDAHRFREAADHLKIAEAAQPNEASVHYHEGLAYFRMSDFNKAIAEATVAIKLDKDEKLSYMLRGESYLKKAEFDLALADLNHWIELDPDDSSAYGDRAQCLNAKGRSEEALADASKAVSLDPKDWTSYNTIGISLMRLNRFRDAIDAFTKAIEIQPASGFIYYNRAIARLHEKQKKLAEEDIAEAHSLGFRAK